MFGLMEGMLSFLRRQVGLRTDAADANGSAIAQIRHAIPTINDYSKTASFSRVVPSNTIILSALTERSTTGAATKVKEVRVSAQGKARAVFDIRGTAVDANAIAQIYLNGVAWGSSVTVNSATYLARTIDNIPILPGDAVELWISRSGSSGTTFVRNFTLRWDVLNYPGSTVQD